MVITNMKEQVMQKSLSTVDILIHPLTYFQSGILSWVVVEMAERQQYTKKKVQIYHPIKLLDFMLLNTYQNAQIMTHSPLVMLWNVVGATN